MSQPAGVKVSAATLRRERKEKLLEVIGRLGLTSGVFGVMVTTEDWDIIESTFTDNVGLHWKHQMKYVEHLGIAFIRDSEPENDLQFLRIQTVRFEILLSIAKDHRVLVVFNSSAKRDPLKYYLQQDPDHPEPIKFGKDITGMILEPCRPHTKKIGGEDQVIITEKISGELIDQRDDINRT